MKSGAILKALMRQKAQVQKISSESTDFPLRKGGRVGGAGKMTGGRTAERQEQVGRDTEAGKDATWTH